MARRDERRRRYRREEKERMTNKDVAKQLLFYFTGAFIFVKIFKVLASFFSRKKRDVAREVERRSLLGTIWYFLKRVLAIGLLLLAVSLIVVQAYNFVYQPLQTGDNGIESPGDLVTETASATSSAVRSGVDNIRVSVMTPFWRQECQRRYIQQNPENMDELVENCVRQKQGLPPEEGEEDEEWSLRGASNYLDVGVRTEVSDADYLEQRCGERCGIVETTFENPGSREVTIEDLHLTVSGGRSSSNYPINFYPSEESGVSSEEAGMVSKLDYFIRDGQPVTGSLSSISSDGDDLHLDLLPGERKNINYLVNLTRFRGFSIGEVEKELEQSAEYLEEEVSEDENVSEIADLCEEGLYDGERVRLGSEDEFIKDSRGYSFEQFSGQVCLSHVEDSVLSNADWLMGSEDVTPTVSANYSSSTESVLNLRVWNSDVWASKSTDEAESTMNDECRPIGSGDSLKQTSDLQHDDAVAILLYTDCRALSQEDEEVESILDFQVQADESVVEGFELQNVEGSEDAETDVCSSLIENDPLQVLSSSWFTRENDDWNTPTTACYLDLPATSNEATLNLGIDAEYTAEVEESGEFQLQ